MPRNLKGGNKAKKGKNAPAQPEKKLLKREECQEYAQVLKRLGGNPAMIWVMVYERDPSKKNYEIKAKIRGKMRRRVWLNPGDLILVGLRDFNVNSTVDVIHKYTPRERSKLIRIKEIQGEEDEYLGEEDEDVETVEKKKERGCQITYGVPDSWLSTEGEQEPPETGGAAQHVTSKPPTLDEILLGKAYDEIDLAEL